MGVRPCSLSRLENQPVNSRPLIINDQCLAGHLVKRRNIYGLTGRSQDLRIYKTHVSISDIGYTVCIASLCVTDVSGFNRRRNDSRLAYDFGLQFPAADGDRNIIYVVSMKKSRVADRN